MNEQFGEESRAEMLVAALLYLMTHHARSGCPRLALCIARHMQCLAAHPDTDRVVRDICASLHGAWAAAALPRAPDEALH